MKPINITTIIGARPQFVKAAMVSRALKLHCPEVSEQLIHTGQHFDDNMSGVFFDELGIQPPILNLGIGGGTHGLNTGRMLEQIEKVLLAEHTDWVLVYGDTDTTLAGALAAVKLHIPVAHIEAGLRSFNRRMPEEINRVLTDHMSERLFTPTSTATSNLAREGIHMRYIHQVGDVMYDAALFFSGIAASHSRILDRLDLEPKRYVLVTLHRAENTDDPERLGGILSGLRDSNEHMVWPMHPRTRRRLEAYDIQAPANILVVPPTGYLDMLTLVRHAAIIATDSGGVQKEAYFHRVPCITLREETEWVELVDAGCNFLAGIDPVSIASNIQKIKTHDTAEWPEGFYGLGNASKLIAMDLSTDIFVV